MASLWKKLGKGLKKLADPLGIFSKPQIPEMVMPTQQQTEQLAPPTQEMADEQVKLLEEEDAKLRKKGRASAILGGEKGFGTPNTAAKVLLGE